MKNNFTFNLGDINFTYEGTPVSITGTTVNYECESSVQELAAMGGLIGTVIKEIKGAFGEIAETIQKTEDAIKPKKKDNVAKNAVEEVKNEDKIAAIWDRIMKILPETFVKSGVGQYKYQKPVEPKPVVKKGKGTFSGEEEVDTYRPKERDMEAELELTDHIEFKVTNPNGQSVSIYAYAENISRYGVHPSLYDEFIETLGCDEITKRFVAEMIDCK